MNSCSLTLKNRGELQLARGLRAYYSCFARSLEACAEQAPHLYPFGEAPPHAQRIPRIMWAYWNGPTPPLVVQRCFDNWRRLNPDYSIRILDDQEVHRYLDAVPTHVAGLPVAKRSDWIRLALLRRHGGIWLDASTILTQSLDWVLQAQASRQSDFVGYFLQRYTCDPAFPIVESWFMAAPPESPFIAALQTEFTEQVITRSGAEYIAYLQSLGQYEVIRQNIDIPEYLSIHLAMQQVLRGGGAYRLSLGPAEEGPFYYHALGRWGRTPLKIRLLFSRIRGAVPALIKLRAPDRKRLDDYLERGLYLPGSIAERYLMPRDGKVR